LPGKLVLPDRIELSASPLPNQVTAPEMLAKYGILQLRAKCVLGLVLSTWQL